MSISGVFASLCPPTEFVLALALALAGAAIRPLHAPREEMLPDLQCNLQPPASSAVQLATMSWAKHWL